MKILCILHLEKERIRGGVKFLDSKIIEVIYDKNY